MLDMENALIEFSALDRCDGCGARAYSLARHEDHAAELLFCMHHRKKHYNALLENGWEVVDGTEALEFFADNEKVSV